MEQPHNSRNIEINWNKILQNDDTPIVIHKKPDISDIPSGFLAGIDPYTPKLTNWQRFLKFFGVYRPKYGHASIGIYKKHEDGSITCLSIKKIRR